MLYLAVCDPDLQVTGATVRMGAFVSHLSRYYDITLVNMAGSGHPVAPEIENRFHDRNNQLGVVRRVRVKFSPARPLLGRAGGSRRGLVSPVGGERRQLKGGAEVDSFTP